MIIVSLIVKSMLILLTLPAGYLLMSTIAAYLFRKKKTGGKQIPFYRSAYTRS